MLFVFLLIIIFTNQYLLFNEEFFIIIAFFALCFFVKSNLGTIVENELSERKNKIYLNYLNFLNKKMTHLEGFRKNNLQKAEYLANFTNIQNEYFFKFADMFSLIKEQYILDLNKNLESSFLVYFASLLQEKRKFLSKK